MRYVVSASRKKNQRGNAIIEFAICSTMLLLLMCGITSFSRIFSIESMAQGAAEAGVLFAALNPGNFNASNTQTAALLDTGNYAGATATASEFCTCSVGGAQVSCPASCGSGVTGQTYVQVSVTVPYSPVITYYMLPDPINVTQVACARVQ